MREAAVRATFVQLKAPYVWTTLALTLRPDGSSPVELAGASDFPRHWVYDATGGVVDQRNSTDCWSWLFHSYRPRTPWRTAAGAPSRALSIRSDVIGC